MEKLDKFLYYTESVVEAFAGIGCFILMIAVVTQVVSRYVFHTILVRGLFNISEAYIFPFFVFLALAGSYRANLWPKLDVLANRMSFSKHRIVQIVILCIELVLYATVAYFTLKYAHEMTLGGEVFSAGSVQYPLYPILWIVPFAFFLLCLEILLSIWKWILKKRE